MWYAAHALCGHCLSLAHLILTAPPVEAEAAGSHRSVTELGRANRISLYTPLLCSSKKRGLHVSSHSTRGFPVSQPCLKGTHRLSQEAEGVCICSTGRFNLHPDRQQHPKEKTFLAGHPEVCAQPSHPHTSHLLAPPVSAFHCWASQALTDCQKENSP